MCGLLLSGEHCTPAREIEWKGKMSSNKEKEFDLYLIKRRGTAFRTSERQRDRKR